MLGWLISLLIAASGGTAGNAPKVAHHGTTDCVTIAMTRHGDVRRPCNRVGRVTRRLIGLGTDPARRHVCPKQGPNVPGAGTTRQPPPNAFEADLLAGDRLPRARRIARRHGCIVRVAVRNGMGFPLTMEFLPIRINVAVRDGRIVRVMRIG